MDAQDFHEGEQRIRARAQLDAYTLAASRYYRPYMPEQHRELFERLPFIVVGALDAQGQPWATLLEGPPGFIRATDEYHLRLHARVPDVDPLSASLRAGSPIGLLGIEPRTRRRNRANGVIEEATPSFIDVHVLQSFGNCPKYIQARTVEYVAGRRLVPQVRRIAADDDAFKAIISQADTFFIASAHPRAVYGTQPQYGVDVSHRGGRAGFVQLHDGVLSVDDYSGNNFFNTLGNLELLPRAGLLFIDMAAGALLHLAVRADIEWLAGSRPGRNGTNRVLRFHVDDAWYVEQRSALEWGAAELSPFLQRD
ncbi:MAG: pyridoxamine 5'-phosphate oxidase family protein [Steroidobacteraceae bacterium]